MSNVYRMPAPMPPPDPTALCTCGHEKGEHFVVESRATSSSKDVKGTAFEPFNCSRRWCDCTAFKSKKDRDRLYAQYGVK